MDQNERDGLKEQLRVMAAGRGDGIDLASPERWVIEGVEDPIAFFQHLSSLLPPGSNLYFECAEVAPALAAFYQENRAADAVPVVRDMIFPIPEMFHVKMTSAVTARLAQLITEHSLERSFCHVKGYYRETLLFAFHDAFAGHLLVAGDIPAVQIQIFAENCRATKHYREENIINRDPKQLERFLWALENPDKVKFGRPWWKRLLFWQR